jgi:chemotaxis protein MotB
MKVLSGLMASIMLVTLAAAGCGIPEEQHNKALAKNKKLQRELNELKLLSEKQQGQLSALESDLKKVKDSFESRLAAKKAELARKLAELAVAKLAAEELAKIKKELAAQKALQDQLKQQFQTMISAGKLQLVNINGRLVIKMASKILFKSGRAKTSRKGSSTLTSIAGILKKIDRHFQVAGHTDDVPMKSRRFKDNWALSARRAAVVVRLLEKAGVPGNRLSAAGFSQFQPVASNKTKVGKANNRRIEITLLPSIPGQVRD